MALDEPFEGPTRHGGYEEEREAEPQQRLVGMGVGAGFGKNPGIIPGGKNTQLKTSPTMARMNWPPRSVRTISSP